MLQATSHVFRTHKHLSFHLKFERWRQSFHLKRKGQNFALKDTANTTLQNTEYKKTG